MLTNGNGSDKDRLCWRTLKLDDVPGVFRIANEVHDSLPEDREVFAERIKLFPEGCLALVQHDSTQLYGYAISHPIRYRQPPLLNSFLEHIAADADQYYIHDLAISKSVRGQGHSEVAVKTLLAIGRTFETTSLISVYGTMSFWSRFGFEKVTASVAFHDKLSTTYGEDATYLERNNA